MRMLSLLLTRWCILHCLSTTTILSTIRRHLHRRRHRWGNMNWRESAAVAAATRTSTTERRWATANDADVMAMRVRRIVSADRQTHRHSRHQHRGGTGPVKIDEEGHLIYKDGDVLFERCTSFLRSRNVATLASLHFTGTHRFTDTGPRHCSLIVEFSTCLGLLVMVNPLVKIVKFLTIKSWNRFFFFIWSNFLYCIIFQM